MERPQQSDTLHIMGLLPPRGARGPEQLSITGNYQLESLAQALYRHPAFAPHRVLGAVGLRKFWQQNAAVTAFSAALLTLCAWGDHSFFILNGYGYLGHPAILGWYLVQLIMPVSIYRTVRDAARAGKHYRQIARQSGPSAFRVVVCKPMVAFVGFRTPASRSAFALLFLIGFSTFAWNTFQNLLPGRLAPLDFWDSIHFPLGYFGTRLYKFYLDALLLPSIVHIFTGVVSANASALRTLRRRNGIRLAPFHADGCGGYGFLADLILSPTISALVVSGLAFFGVVYTHRTFDVSTVTGIVVQAGVLAVFYVAPTFALRALLCHLKNDAAREIQGRQEAYYEAVYSGRLRGSALREAQEYLRYFSDISAIIKKIPNWPHLAKASSIFGASISPALISWVASMVNSLVKLYPKLHSSLP